MNGNPEKIIRISEYIQGLLNKENGRQLYDRYQDAFEEVGPQDLFGAFYRLMEKGLQPKELLGVLDKVINVAYEGLSAHPWKMPANNGFLLSLMMENQALIEKLEAIKGVLREEDQLSRKEKLIPRVEELLRFNHHYLKKENILFPYMERKMEQFGGLSIMWSLHDEAREKMKQVLRCLESGQGLDPEFNRQIGSLFFILHGLVKKEELILLPAASEVLTEEEWAEMGKQSLEYEFPFIEKPEEQPESAEETTFQRRLELERYGTCKFKTETGELDFEQILMIFNALPVDMTFVDEHNKVRYFSRPKDRFFPRSPAIIGRDVDKCHPPESVHVVHQIVESFRSGNRDTATFWINLKGKMILIQYFALRNSEGEYKGVLEVSQDITEIKSLEGERRLLQWED